MGPWNVRKKYHNRCLLIDKVNASQLSPNILRIGCTPALMRQNALFLFSLNHINHSHRISEKQFNPWVVSEKIGKILTVHCDCMTGISKSCSHVASLLWAVEAGARKQNSLTVTYKKAYSVLPSAVKSVPYAKVKDNNFSKFNKKSEGKVKKIQFLPYHRQNWLNVLSISSSSSKPTVLSIIHQYSDCHVPKALQSDFPTVMSDLYDPTLLDRSFEALLKLSESKLDCLMLLLSRKKLSKKKLQVKIILVFGFDFVL